LMGLGAGSNAKKKIWPKENYLALVEKVGNDFDAVIFLGDDRDKEHSKYISSKIDIPCINLCGRTSILEAVAIQQCLEFFVGNDSGLGHLASAAGIPTLTVFGTGEPDRYRPWGNKALWLAGEKQNVSNIAVDDVVGLLQKQMASKY